MIFQIIYLFENTLSQKSANTEIKVKNEHQTIQASLSKRETCTSQGVELHENQELHKKQELSLILIPKMSQGRFEPPEVLTHTHTQIWRPEVQQTNSSLFFPQQSAFAVAILLSRNSFPHSE